MAGILVETGSPKIQILASVCALLISLCSGIHFGWPGASLPKILSPDYPVVITSEEGSYISTISSIGMIGGSLASSIVLDVIGRKITILLITVPQIISMILIYFAEHLKILFYIARLIGGLSDGACFTVLPLYIGEITEPKIRGILGTYFSLSMIIGILISNIIGYYFTIKEAAIIYSLVPIIAIILFIRMPESPAFYLMKNRINDAEECLKRLYGKINVENELNNLRNDIQRQLSERGGYKELFTIKSNRMALIIALGLRIIQQFSGAAAITAYNQIFFRDATDLIPEHWASVIIFSLQIIFTIIASLLVDKTGRRPSIIFSCIGCCIALISLSMYFIVRDYYYRDIENLSFIPLICIMVYIMTFAIGLGSVVNLMLGELFSASVKAKASSLMIIVFAILIFVTTVFYRFLMDNIGVWVAFLIFGIFQFFGAIFSCYLVPETKGKTLEQIQQELKGNLHIKP